MKILDSRVSDEIQALVFAVVSAALAGIFIMEPILVLPALVLGVLMSVSFSAWRYLVEPHFNSTQAA
ncbi:hypothetical protein [Allopseudospirillum japonicum]|nr:hypothetical protein [Allopseudospirillum japonicum]